MQECSVLIHCCPVGRTGDREQKLSSYTVNPCRTRKLPKADLDHKSHWMPHRSKLLIPSSSRSPQTFVSCSTLWMAPFSRFVLQDYIKWGELGIEEMAHWLWSVHQPCGTLGTDSPARGPSQPSDVAGCCWALPGSEPTGCPSVLCMQVICCCLQSPWCTQSATQTDRKL